MGEKKVRLRMGMHNRITAERYHIIRGAVAEGMSDAAIEAKYEVKRTTLGYIKRSKNYYEYQLLTEKLPAARKLGKVIAPKSGLAFEDYPMSKTKHIRVKDGLKGFIKNDKEDK